MKITIIGSGNVATHLAIRLKDIGEEIVEVYSPHSSHAESLAQKAGCKAVTSTDEINDDSLGAEFFDINSLSKNNLSLIAILELEKLRNMRMDIKNLIIMYLN